MEFLTTPRMRLAPATSELVRAEIGDRTEFARLLGAKIPSDWPLDEMADALPWFLERLESLEREYPREIGWYGFYGVVTGGVVDAPVLVGGGGCLGPPVDGSVEIGYSVLPSFQRRGYATEMMTAIVSWVGNDQRIQQITAETATGNLASRRLLSRLGFHEAGPGRDAGAVLYMWTRVGLSTVRGGHPL